MTRKSIQSFQVIGIQTQEGQGFGRMSQASDIVVIGHHGLETRWAKLGRPDQVVGEVNVTDSGRTIFQRFKLIVTDKQDLKGTGAVAKGLKDVVGADQNLDRAGHSLRERMIL